MKEITFITGNQNKVSELENYLNISILQRKLDLPEIQSLSLEEVATMKAKTAYDILGTPVLVEDSSLVLKALGKLPGPFIKYFLESIQSEGLVKILNVFDNREAVAEACFALADENGVRVFLGQTEGLISMEPKGEGGFGFDNIFIPKGDTQTWAEMKLAQKQKTSMRARALDKLKGYLQKR